MPIYTYRREDGTTFDYRQTFRDNPLERCPSSGQVVTRVIQPAGIIFKGSGFYVNDNNKANNPPSLPAPPKMARPPTRRPKPRPNPKLKVRRRRRRPRPTDAREAMKGQSEKRA